MSDMTLANSLLSITRAFEIIDWPITVYGKNYCPAGEMAHEDGGRSKSLRVYPDTNSAWCFVCQEFLTPVRVVALGKQLEEQEATEEILDIVGYVPNDYKAQWEATTNRKQALDLESLSQSLILACSRMHGTWEDAQFDDEVASALRDCLEILPRLSSPDDASRWLSVSKSVMKGVLNGQRV